MYLRSRRVNWSIQKPSIEGYSSSSRLSHISNLPRFPLDPRFISFSSIDRSLGQTRLEETDDVVDDLRVESCFHAVRCRGDVRGEGLSSVSVGAMDRMERMRE